MDVRRTFRVIVAALLALTLEPCPVPGQAITPDGSIHLYQRMLQRNPRDGRTYYRLGDAYVQKARETGDVTYFNLAEQALEKALAIDPGYDEAARHLAFVLYSRHDFEGAAREARRALALNDKDALAWGVLGDAQLEIGRYDEADHSYAQMMRLAQDLHTYARRAGLKSLKGNVEGAVQDLTRAIEDGLSHRRPRESVAWAQWQLGTEYFNVGDLGQAEKSYTEALATYPGYYRASAGLAHVRAAQGRYLEAIDLYQRSLTVIPLPDTVAVLGEVYERVGRGDEARKQYALVQYIGDLNSLNKTLYNRELAYFYANHDMKPREAVALARKEHEIRQDIYAYDILAWALHKAGQHEEAKAAVSVALRLGTRDARLFYHAGMIHAALGENDAARKYLRDALTLNPHFDLRQAPVAERTLTRLGESKP